MRLDRLEISGFKSFSDRAELAFDEGVTAIVGPNGCGKSNVADAITWVLGEQSAKSLRGERMEDVIFNGSDARKPGGTAEVRLRLSGLAVPPQPATDTPAPLTEHLVPFQPLTGEPAIDAGNGHGNGHATNGHAANGHATTGHGTNGPAPLAHGFDGGTMAAVAARAPGTHPDLDEFASSFTRDVEVTRRLYRSGDSEYLIDGQVCRLRDVHELLMDTGLGAKAYAIIEQGKIGMILSSRPADRRQLIEEAAGITKYKSRRRAAELKLEAAQQNLARIDDIVFEVEKQRGTLKRQAAKARRYKKLREELRRWEKVQFARRYRELSKAIEEARERLAAARERETAAGARVAEFENDLSRLRLELTAVEERASAIREDAHARELQVSARQQQLDFNRQQDQAIAARSVLVAEEVRELESRREPARLAIEARRAAALEAEQARDAAAAQLTEATDEHARARAGIEALEADVDGVRSEVYNGGSAMAAIRHAVQHAAAQAERVAELLGKLDVERQDLTREAEATAGERAAVLAQLSDARTSLEQVRAARSEREREIADVRQALDASLRDVRTREQEAAALEARLASLEELASSRAEFGDAARLVLQQANGRVGQMGALADYLDVEPAYERAVEASLGDLLQYVVVERHAHASEGLSLVRGADAGRCGFVVLDADGERSEVPAALRGPGVVPVADVVRVSGPHAETVRRVLHGAYVADGFDRAVAFARQHDVPVATPDGDLVRGRHLVAGGARVESRGILATKREIRDLRTRVDGERVSLAGAVTEAARLDAALAAATSALSALVADQHEHEKAIVGHEAQVGRVDEAGQRHARRNDVIALEERQAQEERVALDARQQEAAHSIAALEVEHRQAEERLAEAQRRLAEHRDAAASLSDRVAGVGALHAGLVERVTAVVAEIGRLEESARDLETRIQARSRELEDNACRRANLARAIEEGVKAIDEEAQWLDGLRVQLVSVDEEATGIRGKADAQEAEIRTARAALDETRTEAGEFDLARVQSESDLSHLAQTCMDAVQLPLDTVLAEVVALEEAGDAVPDAAALAADEPETETFEEHS